MTSNTYYDWLMSDGAAAFPPSERPSSFSIDQMVEKMRRNFDSQ